MSRRPPSEAILRHRRPLIVLAHAVLIAASLALAFLIRFDFDVPATEWRRAGEALVLLLAIRMAFYWYFKLYEGLWRYVSMRDILAILRATTLSEVVFVAAVLAFSGYGFPRSIFVIDWLLCIAFVAGTRLSIRAFRESSNRYRTGVSRRALIVGAGDAGERLIRGIQQSLIHDYEIVGLIDDDQRRSRLRIHGVRVLGTVEQIPQVARSVNAEEVLMAIPSATLEEKRLIAQVASHSGLSVRTVPSMRELIDGKARIGELEKVTPEDLLEREPVTVDLERLRADLTGKSILVTGAGGSIGSELCRQLAPFEPGRLVMLDRSESTLYLNQVELEQRYPDLNVVPVIGDILDRRQVGELFDAHRPDVIYHAAAYKHVPLMEAQPLAAIENNVFGTENLALAAQACGASRFVFISTDKAVTPVGTMGRTKRVAESLLLALNGGSTTFVAVRFGNVLGSDGSVVPLFRRQLLTGKPLTVTDPEATRYFMLISEAAQLVLQAGHMGEGGQVFFLNMGDPVRIMDLAENLIRLSGLSPGRDVRVDTTGLRPGERLSESLAPQGEELLPSGHEDIFMAGKIDFDAESYGNDLRCLREQMKLRDVTGALTVLADMASRY
ncbi:MAG: polysaccharide biosynthesis protein [Actinobacteria bacterium]|nr:polysaccharide biosynthesis protein [Actinomycetota bacterium]